jgi:hypothetical protein
VCICFLVCFSVEAIKGNGKLIPHVVKLWVESYEKDPTSAMVELLTMLFEVQVLEFDFM